MDVCRLLVLCMVAAAASAPAAYAESLGAVVVIPEGAHEQGCEESGDCYAPAHVTIHTGGTVTWVNEDTAFHTVAGMVPENDLFSPFDISETLMIDDGDAGHEPSTPFYHLRGRMQPGETYSRAYAAEPGNYTYYCKQHPWSTGTITVVAPGSGGHDPGHPAGAVYAAMDRQTGVLEVILDDAADAYMQPGKIQIRDGAAPQGVDLSEAELVRGEEPGIAGFRLAEENRQKAAGYADPVLYFGPSVLSDGGGDVFPVSIRPTRFERAEMFHAGGPDDVFKKAAFSDDGTRFFVLDKDGHRIHRYDLPLPYNTSDPVHVYSVRVDLGYDTADPEHAPPVPWNGAYRTAADLSFSAGGTTLFVLAYGRHAPPSVHAYALASPYETAELEHSGSIVLDGPVRPTVLYLPAAGDLMFISDRDTVVTYAMGVPYDISTAEYVSEQDAPVQGDRGPLRDMAFSAGGTDLFMLGGNLYRYELEEPYDLWPRDIITWMRLRGVDVTGLEFSDDGTRMFLLQEGLVQEYGLSAPFEIPVYLSPVPGPPRYVSDVAFSDDGMRMFAAVAGPDIIYSYGLPSPYNTTGPEHLGSYRLGDGGPAAGLAFSDDGTMMFVSRHGVPGHQEVHGGAHPEPDARRTAVHRYALSSPYDVSSLVPSGSLELRGGIDHTGGLVLVPDGMSVLVAADDTVHRYALSSPYDISSPVFDGAYNLGGHVERVRGLELSPDGRRMMVSEDTQVHSYDLAWPYDLDRARHLGIFDTGGQQAAGLALPGGSLFVAGDDSIARYGPDERLLRPTDG